MSQVQARGAKTGPLTVDEGTGPSGKTALQSLKGRGLGYSDRDCASSSVKLKQPRQEHT
jgi:hypothetical protein